MLDRASLTILIEKSLKTLNTDKSWSINRNLFFIFPFFINCDCGGRRGISLSLVVSVSKVPHVCSDY